MLTKEERDRLPNSSFCGTSAKGNKERSYPVNDEKHCSSAISMSVHSKNPCKIIECALKKAEKNGWECGQHSELVESCRRGSKIHGM